MKASIDRNGVITIKAESEIESFALGAWARQAGVDVTGTQAIGLNEDTVFRASRLIVDAGLPADEAHGTPHA